MSTLRRASWWVIVLAAALVLALPVEAKGPPNMVTITGPGIDGEIRISDADMLMPFSFYQFNNLERRIKAPEGDLGPGYRITRYIVDSRGGKNSLKAWDYLTYYPNPSGGLGYLYFDGLDPAIGSTEGQEEWYLPSEDGDAAIRRVLGQYGVLEPAAPNAVIGAPAAGAQLPAGTPTAIGTGLWPAAAAAGITAVLAAAWLQARRRATASAK